MEKTIEIPDGVEITIEGMKVVVKGPKGSLSRDFSNPKFDHLITISKEENNVKITSVNERRKVKALVGTIGAHLRNMIKGVTEGFVCIMKIHYLHFPINVTVKDGKVHIRNFLGEKGDRIADIVGDVKVEVGKDEIKITGIDKEAVGQTAANIEQACRVKDKDRRIFQDGIFIYQKPK